MASILSVLKSVAFSIGRANASRIVNRSTGVSRTLAEQVDRLLQCPATGAARIFDQISQQSENSSPTTSVTKISVAPGSGKPGRCSHLGRQPSAGMGMISFSSNPLPGTGGFEGQIGDLDLLPRATVIGSGIGWIAGDQQ